MRALIAIAVAFTALSIRGLAPVAAWGGPRVLLALVLAAIAACLIRAWRQRREGSEVALRDPIVFVLLAHFPLFAASYFWLGANHGVDAINHLEYIRSMVIDHDLDIRNDDAILGGVLGDNPEPDPTQINMHGIGPAFVWAPLYLTAHALCGAIGQACNGAARPYLAACTLTSIFLSVLGLVWAYRLSLRFASRGAAFLGVLGIAWGTFLLWYFTGEPTMSHNLSFASAALTFLLIQRGPSTPLQWFVVGLSIGYSATIRFANALLGAAAIPTLLSPRNEKTSVETTLRNAVALGAGAAIAFAPQMYAWWRIFGSPLLVPNGEGFLDHAPAFLGVLFSPRGGLFTWSPILYLSVIGLFAFRRLGWRTALGFWSVIILLYVTNARVPDWWGGSSFGNRRFCTILPAMAVGLAIFADKAAALFRRRPLIAVAFPIALLSIWNVLIASGHREHAWEWNEPVSFPQMAHVAIDQVERTMGSPFALPGAIIESLRSGSSIADYDAAIFRRPYSTLVLRLGDGDIPFLRDGWSLPKGTGDGQYRSTHDGSLRIPLQRAVDYVVGVNARNIQNQSLHIEVNGVLVTECTLTSAMSTCEAEVSASRLKAGINDVRLRVVSAGGGPVQEGDVRGFWMRPISRP